MPARFTIHGESRAWRDLAEAAEWASQVDWVPERTKQAGDHQHCALCSWDVAPTDAGTSYRHHGHWLCAECFGQFVIAGSRCYRCAKPIGSEEVVESPALTADGVHRRLCRPCHEMESVPAARRWASGLEFLAGAGIVIGHNVLRILPNEVPILVGLALVSTRLRSGRWRLPCLDRPTSWPRTLGIAVAAAALRVGLGEFVIDPITAHFLPAAAAPAGAESIAGNLAHALVALAIVWTFAAFGEEISYRGYLLPRAAEAGGGKPAAQWIAVALVAVLFGFGHFYKGPAGIIDSGVAGLVLGAAYVLSGRNLWAPVVAHGLIDTYAVVVTYLGWAT